MRKFCIIALLVILILAALPLATRAAMAASNRNSKALVLMYHHLAPSGLNMAYNRVILNPLHFEAQMKYLRDNNYNVISLRDLAASMESNKALPAKAVVITFDDGYESNYVYAYPILKKYNLKATINLIVGSIRESNPTFQPEVTSMLTWSQVREMQESGLIDFQSHTYDLHHYGPLDSNGARTGPLLTNPVYDLNSDHKESREEYRERVYKDLVQAKAVLEEKTGRPIFALAYPYGSYNKEAKELARKAGYRMLLTIRNGLNSPGEALTEIKRVNVGRGEDFAALLQKWFRPGSSGRFRKIPVTGSGLLLRQMEKGNTILR